MKKQLKSIDAKILEAINLRGHGSVFVLTDFLHLGSGETVDGVLHRLMRKGTIKKMHHKRSTVMMASYRALNTRIAIMSPTSWVLITGSTSPLGCFLAEQLVEAGYGVILHYNSQRAIAKQLEKKFHPYATAIQGNFSSHESIETFLESYRQLPISCSHLINNASLYAIGALNKSSVQQTQQLFQVNLYTPLLLIQSLTAELSNASGSVLNIGVAGLERLQANMHHGAYHLTKLALWRATRTLAKELITRSVRVNMLSPGHMSHSQDLETFKSDPCHRTVSLRSMAQMTLFLLGEQGREITGQNIEIAAGSLL